MSGYTFIDRKGTFTMKDPQKTSALYFPIANEAGIKSSVTPLFGGDSKCDQNTFILPPVSACDLHNTKNTRNFWLKIGKNVWSATGASAEAEAAAGTEFEEKTELTAGLMWQSIVRHSEKYKVSSKTSIFAPVSDKRTEIIMVEITNDDDKAISVVPIAAVPLYGRSAANIRDHRHVTSLLHRVDTIKEGILLKPTLTFDERGHKVNEETYFVCGCEEDGKLPAGFYPTEDDFIGEGGSYARPRAVYEDMKAAGAGEHFEGYECAGGIRFEEKTIAAHSSCTYIVMVGMSENRKDIEDIFAEYSSLLKAEKALEKVKEYWTSKINVGFKTNNAAFDNFMYWVCFQPVLRRIYGCSFLPHHDYGKGGRGWRDLWQDCLALLMMEPEGVRDMLVSNFAGVRIDGSNATIIGEKQGEFVADRNGITRVWMDHGLWPFMTTEFYISQTGDTGILFEKAPYFKDRQINRGEAVDDSWKAEQGTWLSDCNGNIIKATVLEHILLQNVTQFFDVGAHNHMRLRGADWNDALDMASENGESVAFTAAYAGNLEKLSALLMKLSGEYPETELSEEIIRLIECDKSIFDDIDEKKKHISEYYASCRHVISGRKRMYPVKKLAGILEDMSLWIKEHIRKTEWLGGFFNGYYDNSGRQVEKQDGENTRMMLTSQVFTIMSGTADEAQTDEIIRSCDKYLYSREIGGYRLNTDFKEIKKDLGRMFGFAYGTKENGAVFSHMAVMYGNALYARKRTEAAYKVVKSLFEASVDFEKSRIYPGLPEYFDGRGRGMYHYLTGSASWLMMTVLNQMFGAKGDYGDLIFEPQLMPEQFEEGRVCINITFQGCELEIEYILTDTGAKVIDKAEKVLFDGKETEDGRISKELLKSGSGKKHKVQVYVK